MQLDTLFDLSLQVCVFVILLALNPLLTGCHTLDFVILLQKSAKDIVYILTIKTQKNVLYLSTNTEVLGSPSSRGKRSCNVFLINLPFFLSLQCILKLPFNLILPSKLRVVEIKCLLIMSFYTFSPLLICFTSFYFYIFLFTSVK